MGVMTAFQYGQHGVINCILHEIISKIGILASQMQKPEIEPFRSERGIDDRQVAFAIRMRGIHKSLGNGAPKPTLDIPTCRFQMNGTQHFFGA